MASSEWPINTTLFPRNSALFYISIASHHAHPRSMKFNANFQKTRPPTNRRSERKIFERNHRLSSQSAKSLAEKMKQLPMMMMRGTRYSESPPKALLSCKSGSALRMTRGYYDEGTDESQISDEERSTDSRSTVHSTRCT